MQKTKYKITIDETERNNLKESATLFNKETHYLKNKKEIKKFLIDKYNKIPKIKENNKIYINTKKGTINIGFIVNYWNRDISHNSKNWFQSDWITIEKETIKTIDLKEVI